MRKPLNIHYFMLVGIMTSLFLHFPVIAAGFDCSKTINAVEKLVCTSDELSGMDEDLSWFYTKVVPEKKARQKRIQLKWLHERNQCRSVRCLEKTYIARIRALADSNDIKIEPSPGDGAGEARLTLKSGWIPGKDVWGETMNQDGDPLCRDARVHMNRYANTWVRRSSTLYENACVTASLSIPGMEVPPWTDLIPLKHIGLIAKLLRLRDELPSRYFDPTPFSWRRDDVYYSEAAKAFVEEGGRIKLWQTILVNGVNDARTGELIDLSHSQQSLIQLGWPHRDDQLAFKSQTCRVSGWVEEVFVVNSDLSDPLAISSPLLINATAMLYHGQPILIHNDSSHLEIAKTLPLYGGVRCILSPINR